MQGEGLLIQRRRWWQNRLAVPLALALVATQIVLSPFIATPEARADSHTAITTTADDGSAGSLREVISAAAVGSTVVVPDLGSGYVLSEALVISKDLTIVGEGDTALDVVVDGDGNDRVFDITGGDVTLENLTITGGHLNGKNNGGGIRVGAAHLDLLDVQVQANTADVGAGIHISADGSARVERSTIVGNDAQSKGGGINNDGLLQLVNSTVTGNDAKQGGGIATPGTAHLSFVTVWDNFATNKQGAGVFENGGTYEAINSIIANNIGGQNGSEFHDCSGSPTFTNVIVTSLQGCNPSGDTFELPAGTPVTDLALPLALNAPGKTETHELPDGDLTSTGTDSPAIDATTANSSVTGFTGSICLALAPPYGGDVPDISSDQRGFPRDADCDVGAYEDGIVMDVAITSFTATDEAQAQVINEVEVGAVRVPIANILNAAQEAAPDETSTASTPVSAIPVSAIPVSAIPVSAIPVSAIPVSAIDLLNTSVLSTPVSAIPVSAIPVSAILLSELSTDDGTSLGDYLIGSDLEGVPLVSLNLGDLISTPVSAIDLFSTPVSAIPVSAIPVSAIGDVIDCSDPNVFDCDDPSKTIGDAFNAEVLLLDAVLGDVLTLGDFNLGSTPVSAIPVSAIFLAGLPVSAIPVSAIDADGNEVSGLEAWCIYLGDELCSALGITSNNDNGNTLLTISIAGAPVSAIPVSAIPVSAIPVSAIGESQLLSTPVSAIPVSAIFWASTPVSAIPVSAIPVSAIDAIIDCTKVDCGTATLGEVDDANAFLVGVTLGDLIATGALNDATLGDLLLGLIPPTNVPWEQIDLEASRLPNAADPKQEAFRYEVAFTLQNGGSADVVATLTPPQGFLYAGDVADPVTLELAGSAPDVLADPVEGDGGVLTLGLGSLDPGQYTLTVAMRAGLVLGSHEASVLVASSDPFQSADDEAQTSIQVNQAVSGDSGLNGAPVELEFDGPTEEIQIGHMASPDFVDLYTFNVPVGFHGSARILLSYLFEDHDLVLYGPPLEDPLRGDPLFTLDGVEDPLIFDLNPDDDVLDTDTLQDIPHDPALVGLGSTDAVLHSVSSKRGTNDEEIDTGTLRPGDYYIQVSPYNGTFSEHPYALRMRVTSTTLPSCVGYDSGFSYPSNGAPGVAEVGPNVNTLFLYNASRLEFEFDDPAIGDPTIDPYDDLLNELSLITAVGNNEWEALGVNGAVIAVDEDPAVLTALNYLEDHRCDPHASNAVVRAIGDLIDDLADGPDDDAGTGDDRTFENIVIVGDDSQIAHARIPDGTAISNERTHASEFVEQDNETVSSLAAGYYFSDDPYGTKAGIAVNNHELFIPEAAVGRLVEGPADIAQALRNFRTFDGRLDQRTGSFVTGYDFLDDGANEVADNLDQLEADFPWAGFGAVTRLINETWTGTEVAGLLDDPFLVASLNAHFDHRRLLTAAGNSGTNELFETTDLPTSITDALLFSMGCHSGLSVSDIQILGSEDWAQRFASAGNLYAANSGFGYGDTKVVGLSEALSAAFAKRLGTMSVGNAWMGAKQEIASTLFTIDPYHEKILQEFIFFGLPMFLLGAEPPSQGSLQGPGAVASATGILPLTTNAFGLLQIDPPPAFGTGPTTFTDPITGLTVAAVTVEPGAEKTSTSRGDYYHVDDQTLNVRGRPIEPLTYEDITQPDGLGDLELYATGALITGLSGFQDLDGGAGFDPVYFTPTVDVGDATNPGTEDVFRRGAGDATFPTAIQKVATFTDDSGQVRQSLVLVPGRYVRQGPGGVASQEVFTEIQTHVYYGSPDDTSDFTPSYISKAEGFHGDGVAYFEVTIGPTSSDTERVYVLLRRNGAISQTTWLGLDLVKEETRADGTTLWAGRRPASFVTPEVGAEFFVQAVNSKGIVSLGNAKGVNYETKAGIGVDGISISVEGGDPGGPVDGWYGTDDNGTNASGTNPVRVEATSSTNITSYSINDVVTQIPAVDQSSQLTVELTDEGAYEVEVFDANLNEARQFVDIDNTGPSITNAVVTPEPVNGFSAPGASVLITATDNLSGVDHVEYCTLPDCTSSWVTAPDGETAAFDTDTTVRTRAADNAGNIGLEGTAVVITIDDTPPVVTTDPAGGTEAWYADPVVTLIADDWADPLDTALGEESGVFSVSYSTDSTDGTDGTWTTVPGATADVTLTGTSTLWYFATDNVGNPSAPASTLFQIDGSAPSPTIDDLDPAPPFEMGSDQTATVDCDAEGGSPVTCTADVDGDSVTIDGDGTVVLPTDEEGPHTLTVTAVDEVGNSGSASVEYTVQDTTEPTVTTSLTPATPTSSGWYLGPVTIDVTADPDVGTPIDTIGYSLDGGSTWTDVPVTSANCNVAADGKATCSFVVGGSGGIAGDGETTVRFRATDSAANGGNTGTSATIDPDPVVEETVKVDTVDPTATANLSSEGDIGFGTLGPTATVSCVDTLPGSDITSCVGEVLDGAGGVVATVQDGEAVPTNVLGTLTLRVTATDIAGRIGTDEVTYTVVDNGAPLAEIITPTDGTSFVVGQTTDELDAALVFDFNCTDAESGIDSCTGQLEQFIDSSWVVVDAVVTDEVDPIPTNEIGTFRLTVTAVDGAGNTAVASHTYSVGYGVCLLYDPANEQPATGTMPIKLQLCDADGNNLSSAQLVLTATQVRWIDDPSGQEIVLRPGPNDQGKSNDSFELRFDGRLKGYIYNFNVDELFDPEDPNGTPIELDPADSPFFFGFVVTDESLPLGADGFPDPSTDPEVPALVVYEAEFNLK